MEKCFQFDRHDTEDCPTQTMVDDGEDDLEMHAHHQGSRNSTRTYCDNCEAFGHDTSECDGEETF
jgi:CAP-Gly domain-containing linker protein 1